MSEDLGDFASLLGEGFSQAAQYDDRDRRKQQKRAMRDQLLYAFAAPLVSAAGKGIVDFGADVLLGSNSKDFFSTVEGNRLLRKVKQSRDDLEVLKEHRQVLTEAAKGGSLYEGAEELARDRLLEKQLNRFAELGPEAEAQIRAANYSLTDEQKRLVHDEVDDLKNAIYELEMAPSDDQIVSRYAQTPLSRGRGGKLFGKAARFFTGGDYVADVRDPSIELILTGGDPEVKNSEWYNMISSDEGFKEKLNNYIKEAATLTPKSFSVRDMIDSSEVAFRGDPEFSKLLGRLEKRLNLQREAGLEKFKLQEAARGNRQVAEAMQQLETANLPITEDNVMRNIVQNIQGIEKPQESAGNFFRTNSGLVEELRNTIAVREKGIEQFDSSRLTSKLRNEIDTAIGNRIEEAYGFFNQQLFEVKSELANLSSNDPRKQAFLNTQNVITSAGISNLADDFVYKLFTEHMPRKTVPVFKRSLLQDLTNQKVSVPSGFVTDPEELRSFIEDSLTNVDTAVLNEDIADRNGTTLRLDRQANREGRLANVNIYNVVSPSTNKTAVEVIQEINDDLSLTREERNIKIKDTLDELENNLLSGASARGFAGLDDQTMMDLRNLRKKYLEPERIGGRTGRNRSRLGE